MQAHNLVQGSPEWAAHRASHFNASDAPAMMGCSSYRTRGQLLGEIATGVVAEIDAGTQRIFDAGHQFEALARPLAEEIIGEELYPCVGTEGRLSASFDGLTLLENIAFEHKSLNNELRAAFSAMGIDADAGHLLPMQYQVQMEQQCMVSGCDKVLFMATKWQGTDLVECHHCWYIPNPELAERIRAGWTQFEQDLADYVPPAAAPIVVAAPVQALPAVSVQVEGEIAIRHNFATFERALRDFIDHRLIREPKTDQDFADLDLQIKAMKGAEAALDAAESQMLAQMATVDTAKKTKDMLAALVRDNRLMAEKLLASEKERRRGEIVAAGVKDLSEHVAALNARLGKPYMPAVPADFGGAIKGKKNLASMEEAVGVVLVNAKIFANTAADRIQINLGTLHELAAEHMFLFPDTAQIVQKQAEDLTMLVRGRIAEHAAKEAARLGAEREQIRMEEVARLEREQAARDRAAAVDVAAMQRNMLPEATPALASFRPIAEMSVPAPAASAEVAGTATLKLGEINARLAPVSISADGLRQLGFESVGRDRAAVLFLAADLPLIRAAMSAHILRASS